jgi:hypothetical protein
MKPTLTALRACTALIAIGLSCAPAIATTPAEGRPHITLVSTDTSAPFPFAEIIVGNATYHVTEGDEIAGLYIRRIVPGRITLSDNEVIVAVKPEPPQASGD